MTTTQGSRGPEHLGTTALARCPACHSRELEPVADGESVNFFCNECARCWHLELNRVVRIDPSTCARCEHLLACAQQYDTDHDASTVSA